jgi:hypothetical protein
MSLFAAINKAASFAGARQATRIRRLFFALLKLIQVLLLARFNLLRSPA